MQQNENKEFYIQLKKLVVPIAFQQITVALVSIADALMLGFINQDSLSAVSLAGQVQFVFTLFIYAITAGVSIFAAQYWGIKDRISVEKILGIGLKWSVIVSVPFVLASMLMPETLMRAFANDPNLIEKGAEYLRVVGISYLFLGISQVCLTVIKNCGHAVMCSVISSASVIANVIFNAFLIFGLWIFPEMNIAGAALATVISRVVELVWAVIVTVKTANIRIRFSNIIKNDSILKKDYWKYTLPFLGNEIVWGVGFTMYSVIMGQLGSDAAAANSIANIVKNLAIAVCCGIASASGIMVGNLLGCGKLEKAKLYGEKFVKLSIFSGIASGALILCMIPAVPLFASLSATAQSYLKIMLVVCSYYVIGKSINMTTIAGIYPAGGDTKFGFKCDAITMWLVTVPIGLVSAFVLDLPVVAVYMIINIDEIIKLPAVFGHYKKYLWLKNLTNTNNQALELA